MTESGGASGLTKLLFVTPHLDPNLSGGPALRTQQTVRTLSTLVDLHIYDLDRGPQDLPGAKLRKQWAQIFTLLNPKRSRLGQLLQIVLNTWTLICSPDVLRAIKSSNADAVWINFVSEHSPLVRKIRSNFPSVSIIGDTDSVYSVFLRRTGSNMGCFRKFGYSILASFQERKERRLSRDLDVLTAVSRVDLDYYLNLKGSASVRLFANVIEVPEADYEISMPDNPPQLLLPGSFGGKESAMTNGFNWFCSEVWPLIREARPEANLAVVGRNASAAVGGAHLEGILVSSDVPDMEPFFRKASLVICPLFFESGTRFKILEASKFQVPVVSTSLGAEGLDFVNGTEILIADDAETFANACLALLSNTNLAKRIGKAARIRLKGEYSHDASMTQAIGILEDVDKGMKER